MYEIQVLWTYGLYVIIKGGRTVDDAVVFGNAISHDEMVGFNQLILSRESPLTKYACFVFYSPEN